MRARYAPASGQERYVAEDGRLAAGACLPDLRGADGVARTRDSGGLPVHDPGVLSGPATGARWRAYDRVLTDMPLPTQPFRDEHAELIAHIEHIRQAASEVARVSPEERQAIVQRSWGSLGTH